MLARMETTKDSRLTLGLSAGLCRYGHPSVGLLFLLPLLTDRAGRIGSPRFVSAGK